MGKRGYNWKSRQTVDTVIDDSVTKKIKLDITPEGHYDQNNEFVLPSQKRKTKVKEKKQEVKKILSRKHRKKLEKIVEKKKKKEQRTTLLESLTAVQATPEEFAKLTSITTIQTKGLKKYFLEEQEKIKPQNKFTRNEAAAPAINSVKGTYKGQQIKKSDVKSDDPNVIGFDESDSESDVQTDEEKNDVLEEVKAVQEESVVEPVVEIDKEENCVVTNERKEKENISEKIVVERKPAVFVPVNRKEEIQTARLKLPILAEEQQIMELINDNSVVLIAGETGSGKTTQIPQFLFEAGYALNKQICVTEPRRVAAVSMSQRVAEEMNLGPDEISYLIRFEGNVTENTKIKFVTDGVLLKELQNDRLLSKYSVVILDEAHERSIHTDILIGFLSRIVHVRKKENDPLKLIIMSATLRLKDFTENRHLFKTTPPVVNIDARQFPVTVHFNKRTNDNYLKEALNKTIKVHTKLPEGGILVFLTGQQEVNWLVRKLRRLFPLKRKQVLCEEEETNLSEAEEEGLKKALKKKKKVKVVPQIDLDDYGLPGEDGDQSDCELSGDEEEDEEDGDVFVPQVGAQPMWVLPLYSLLPSHEQAKVFKSAPKGCRLCVVSTNIAETSLTIPNIKYVIDTGKTKVKLYDKITGVTSYIVTWTSKASADQRAGRAGRLGPGHCYRLFSSAVFNDVFEEFSQPEIAQKPVDDIYLQLKCMKIHKVPSFPFPTPPDPTQLASAESRLKTLGALDASGALTPTGRAMARFPVAPRFGKMLALSHQFDLLPYVILLVAALSVPEVLLETPLTPGNEESKAKWVAIRRGWAGSGNSLLLGDLMVLVRAVGAAEYANSLGKLEKFCEENGLRRKAVVEVRKLRLQLTNEVRMVWKELEVVVDPKLKPPTDLQSRLLRQILLSGMGDQLAKKITPDEVPETDQKSKYKYAYRAGNMEQPVFLHRNSVLRRTLPEFVAYQEIYEINGKMCMRGVSAVDRDWLPVYVPTLCRLGEPLKEPEPRYDEESGRVKCAVNATFGTQAWDLGMVEVDYPDSLDGFRWFGRFFLEGKVCKKLRKFVGELLNSGSAMIKSWADLQPRTKALLKGLMGKEVNTKQKLIDVWKENPKYLLEEYLMWLKEDSRNEVTLMWPPLD